MIRFHDVHKQFGDLEVLRGIDVTVAKGRVTGLVGPNAAGKTTLAKIVLGMMRATSGRVEIDGRDIAGAHAYRRRLGYMPQLPRFPENLNGAELLAMLRDLRGGGRIDEELIERFELRSHFKTPLRHLSGGTRQKINAALAFAFEPDLLILDEPTAGLDPVASGILKDHVLASRGAGRTVLITSHIMNELEEVCDDLVFLLDGRIRFAGPVGNILSATKQSTLERAVAVMMIREVA